MPDSNRVWIELDQPWVGPEVNRKIDHALGHNRAELLSKMLKRLGDTYEQPVFWSEKKLRYCFTVGGGGTFVEADDHGHWYNLDYLGRD